MDSETHPIEVLFAESQRLKGFADFWRQRIAIEKEYLNKLSGLHIPDLPRNGQLQELAHKAHKLLLDELEERRRGLAKLNAAYKALTDELWTFEQFGGETKQSLLRMDSLAAEVATAESITERLAIGEREKKFPMPSIAKKENKPRPNVITRLLDKARNAQPEVHESFLSADSAYRQKIQKLNDDKYMKKKHNARYVEHDRKCIVALKHIVSAFSAVHSDLAQVLNVTASQLCIAASSVDVSMESASFFEKLDESFTSLIQPYRYTSYDTSSLLRPTTMLFGCHLPDELDGASIGQRVVFNAFEAILTAATDYAPLDLYAAISLAIIEQGSNDIKLPALELESLWDPSQQDGGPEAVRHLLELKTSNASLLLYFLTRLPEPFLPLYSGLDVKDFEKLHRDPIPAFVQAVNRMGTARRCTIARLFLSFNAHRRYCCPDKDIMCSHQEGIQILIRATGLVPDSYLGSIFSTITLNVEEKIMLLHDDPLILPSEFIAELKRADLIWGPEW